MQICLRSAASIAAARFRSLPAGGRASQQRCRHHRCGRGSPRILPRRSQEANSSTLSDVLQGRRARRLRCIDISPRPPSLFPSHRRPSELSCTSSLASLVSVKGAWRSITRAVRQGRQPRRPSFISLIVNPKNRNPLSRPDLSKIGEADVLILGRRHTKLDVIAVWRLRRRVPGTDQLRCLPCRRP
jgi:hypothetical protein